MKRMTIPAFLMAAVLAFALVGCSQAQNLSADILRGVWKLEPGSDLGMDAYINFEEGDDFEMILGDAWLDGTWAISGASGELTFNSYYEGLEEEESSSSSSDRVAKISYSNNKLIMGSENSSRLVFVKDDSEEAKAMFSFGLEDGQMLDADGNVIEEVPEVIEDITPITVADDDKISIVVTGKGTDYTADPCYRMTITNKTDKDVYVIPEDLFKVGDKEVEAGLGEDLEAGETFETEMFFDKTELGGGLEALNSVEGVIVVCDNDTDEEIGKYVFKAD